MALLQPSYIVEYRVSSLFDAAMIAVDRLMAADLGILKAVGFLLCSERLDILAKRALIALKGLMFSKTLWTVCGARQYVARATANRL